MARAPDWTRDELATLRPWAAKRMTLSEGKALANKIGRTTSAVNHKLWQLRKSAGVKVPKHEPLSPERRRALSEGIRTMPVGTVAQQRTCGAAFGVSDRTVREYTRIEREQGSSIATPQVALVARKCLGCSVPFDASSKFLRLCVVCRSSSRASV